MSEHAISFRSCQGFDEWNYSLKMRKAPVIDPRPFAATAYWSPCFVSDSALMTFAAVRWMTNSLRT